MTRNQRRKASKAKALDKAVKLAYVERNMKTAAIVRNNLSRPAERNYYRGCTSDIYNGSSAPRAVGLGVKN
jgi:BarA-like signal transduction histidine kinase